MYQIKFGTDGWREIIARDYTVDNVRRVALATAKWVKSIRPEDPKVVIGFDCRFGGKMFMQATAEILCSEGVQALVSEEFVSTPMVSLACDKLKASAGIVITASHNPPEYNGFKIKAHYGGPASPAEISKIESNLQNELCLPSQSYESFKMDGKVQLIDMETMYAEHVEQSFDMALLRDDQFSWAYDAMYGAGQSIVRRLLPDSTFLHCELNPGFDGQAPEPIHKNLGEFSEMIEMAGDIDSGLATDGDADRVGLYNAKGEFVDSHHIILLLIHYLHKYKGLTGKVVNSFSCSSKIKKLCELYGLQQETTKIGFKYICDIMVEEDVLIGGEESGGIAIKGHIPERDGVWIGFVIWEYMAKTGKSLDELIQEIYSLVGSFAVERYDLHISDVQKIEIVDNCKNRAYDAFGPFNIERIEDTDGYKFHLGNERWVMIRPSGTEPVLRVYAEAETLAKAIEILDQTKAHILGA
jgi:phosphomannomutase